MNSVKADDMFGDDNKLDLDEDPITNSTAEPLATPEHVKGRKTINDHYSSFIGKLYKLESSVETLRENTMKIVEEKKNLLATLQTILDNDAPLTEDESEEIVSTAERLICRCLTVEVSMTTPRTESQEKAVSRVNLRIQKLEQMCRESPSVNVLASIEACLNACLPEPQGPVDSRFQGEILDCTVDDQKNIRFQLRSLYEQINDVISLKDS